MATQGSGVRSFLLAVGLAASVTAHADWQWVNPQPQGNILADVAHDNASRYVTVGNSGTVLTSTDGGLGWESQTSGANEWLYAVMWTGSEYVTVGDRRTILASTDGSRWEARASGPYTYLYGVANHGNTYVAVGDTGSVLYSNGGQTWRKGRIDWSGAPVADAWLNDVTWAGSRFVAVGASGSIVTSTNGVQWVAQALDTGTPLEAVAWNGSRLVAVGQRAQDAAENPLPKIYYQEGNQWNPASVDRETGAALNGVHWDRPTNQFIAVGDDGEVLTSGDGAAWVFRDSGTQLNLESAGSGSGTLVAVGEFGMILRSNDGSGWNPVTRGSHLNLHSVAIGPTRYVAVGENGAALSGDVSSQGVPDVAHPGSGTLLSDVAWDDAGSRFIAVGADGTVIAGDGSPSGWSPSSVPTAAAGVALHGVAVRNGNAVAVGDGGIACHLGRQRCQNAAGARLNDVADNGEQFIAVGTGGVVVTSPDGLTWNTTRSSGEDLLGIGATDSGWVAVGANGTVLTSRDGSSWSSRQSGTAEPLYDAVWANGQVYALGGESALKHKEGILLVSSDRGRTWASQSATGNDLRGLGARNNAIMAAGKGGTLLRSQCPCATDDAAVTDQGVPVDIDVLANDIGTGLAVSQYQEVSNRSGSVRLNGDGTLAYTPPEGFAGTDSFDYTVSNGSDSDVGTVSVTVNEVPGGTGGRSGGSSGGAATGAYLLSVLWGLLLLRRRRPR